MGKINLKPRAKPKATAVRKPRYTDTKYTGLEPVWDGADKWQEEKLRSTMYTGFSFYNYYHTPGEIRACITEYGAKTLQWDKAKIKAFNAVEDSRVGITNCSMAKMLLRGAPLPANEVETFHARLEKLLEYGAKAVIAKDEKEQDSSAPKRTVQDHLNDKLSEYIGEIEAWYDDIILDKKNVKHDMIGWLRNTSVPQQLIARITAYFEPFAEELKVAKTKDADAQLKEGYAHLTKAQVQTRLKWHEDLVAALRTYGKIKSATRKARAPRPPNKAKIAAKVKYLANNPELNLVSINPVDVIGANTLWVYNVKTRKLGKYVAAIDAGQLGLKGTSILGFDEKESVSKTLRKPADQLKQFGAAGKVALRTYLDTIKSTPVAMNGRINTDTILLKVQT